ncbi:MAG: MBL fold metallo-hydrolase [Actinomycetota bacterium]|nr:MBL fold metallo-hydrolase [Actinomycetota bacterium]
MEEVNVRFLGSGDAFGSGGRFQTCIQVRSGEANFLIDCGASSLVAMKHFGVDPSVVDIILLTHLHGDHFGGLPFFVLDAQYVSRRERPLVVAGPPGLETRITEAMEVLYPGTSQAQREFALEFVELTAGTPATIGPLVVTPYEVVHPSGAPSYALRVECGDKVVAYSGDTEWTDALIQVASRADLFVCECNFLEGSAGYHIDYLTLMKYRAELECRRLVLTHMGEEMLNKVGDLDVEGAHDGKSFAL